MADEIPSEEKDRWPRLQDAYAMAKEALGDRQTAANFLLHRLTDGIVVAIADKAMRTDSGSAPSGTPKPLVEVPRTVWEHLLNTPNVWTHDFWKSSDVMVAVRSQKHHGYNEGHTLKYYGVRLQPDQLAKELGLNPTKRDITAKSDDVIAPVPSQTPSSHPGRPTKEFWEDMVIAATRAILYDDTLRPKTQADVQRWMADWAIKNGHGHPGETALKERARKVFLACRD